MVSWPHNTLIKFLKGSGRGPAQSINSLQVVKRRKVISVCFVVMNETAGRLHGDVTRRHFGYGGGNEHFADQLWRSGEKLMHPSTARPCCKANHCEQGREQRPPCSDLLVLLIGCHTASG